MDTNIAAVAPLLIPLDIHNTAIEGYITSQNTSSEQYYIKLSNLPRSTHTSTTTLQDAHLELGPSLETLLDDQKDLVRLRMNQSRDLPSFLIELKNLISFAEQQPSSSSKIDTLHSNNTNKAPTTYQHHRSPDFYRYIRQEIKSIGWQRIVSVSEDLSILSFRAVDAVQRTHIATITLPSSFPRAPPCVSLDIPIPFTPTWSSPSSLSTATTTIINNKKYHSLSSVLLEIDHVIDSLQWLWNWLDELDSTACIIEPTTLQVQRSMTHRKIALGNHVTLTITLNPLDPGAFPELQLMGSEKIIEPMLATLRTNRILWSPDRNLVDNIQMVLGNIEVPRKDDMKHDVHAVDDMGDDCAICYNYHRPSSMDTIIIQNTTTNNNMNNNMNNNNEEEKKDIPDIFCDNSHCGKPFHRLCLREWLAADATTRQSFGTIFGACPYCSSPISVAQ